MDIIAPQRVYASDESFFKAVTFFKEFLSPKKHIFDDDSWKKIKQMLDKPQVTLKFSKNRNELKGSIFADEKIVDSIKSLNNEWATAYESGLYWNKTCEIPSKPNQLKTKLTASYCLCICAEYSQIAVKRTEDVKDDDYLLARLYGCYFVKFPDCQISVK